MAAIKKKNLKMAARIGRESLLSQNADGLSSHGTRALGVIVVECAVSAARAHGCVFFRPAEVWKMDIAYGPSKRPDAADFFYFRAPG